MTTWLRNLCLGAVALLGVVGCSAGALPVADLSGPAVEEGVRTVPEYRLGAADKVRVNVFGEEALTGEFLVGGSGKVSLPLLGEVQAAGLTISQFQEEIANALRQGYINEPRVSAEVLNYRPFYILGEVNKPGEYPYTNGLTVLNAVATAEGFTYRADTRRVYIKRADVGGEQAFPLTTATQVAPGDTIRIGERFF
ncbi:Polysaccharide biosynthesis/export protein [Brevundimonas sp. BAL3]|uniref:polysaccharide biosynthesis/export family protein n=1 Tax=unclassified Brevundimonas TaxID=2622653 RepID=UPI00017EB3FA|nr:polysaccharide biosynthesis/export family protein [Brevundimonas sp. BAL3]EDX82072.1 Polysaccharide biosynthesis/export protein [Brevundimonas sp. BAL3]